MNVAYRFETHKILVSAFHKIAISRKLNRLEHFVYSFLTASIIGIIHQNIKKDSSKNEVPTNLMMYLTSSKTLGNHLRKRKEGKNDGPVKSFATKF